MFILALISSLCNNIQRLQKPDDRAEIPENFSFKLAT